MSWPVRMLSDEDVEFVLKAALFSIVLGQNKTAIKDAISAKRGEREELSDEELDSVLKDVLAKLGIEAIDKDIESAIRAGLSDRCGKSAIDRLYAMRTARMDCTDQVDAFPEEPKSDARAHRVSRLSAIPRSLDPFGRGWKWLYPDAPDSPSGESE